MEARSENLTIAKLDKYKVEKGRKVWTDTTQKGLGIRVSATGSKVWQVQYRIKGNPTKQIYDIGSYPEMDLEAARMKAAQVKAEARAGKDPKGKIRALQDAITFEDLCNEYLEKHAKPKKASADEDERIIKKDLLPAWKDLKAVEIRRRDVIELLDTVAKRGPIMANRTLALIRKIYNFAIPRDLVEHNPCLGVETVAPEQQRERVLNEAEIRAVWKAFEQMGGLMGAMFKLRLLTAQRGGEVESMRWADVDLDAGWWTIPGEQAKNGLSHRVPLSPPAVEILKALKLLGGSAVWVFPSPRHKDAHIANVSKAAERAQEAAGKILWPDKKDAKLEFVMHDLRRTAASHMASIGVQRLVISKVLNHVESGVTKVYDRHSYDAEKREALERWANHLMEIVSKQTNDLIMG